MGTRRTWVVVVWVALGIAGAATACSSPSSSPSAELPATVTITASGASPTHLVVRPGSQVMFVNHDSRIHQMYSDPHPEHTDCPEFDQVGSLSPGQSRLTGNLNAVRTCNFHDHIYFLDAALRGSVSIQ